MSKKVLIVDDSDLIAGVLTSALSKVGYTVVRAANGLDGIIKAYLEIPDVIIMDVEMPLLQGYQASRLLKARRGVRHIPIIMHTTLAETRDRYWGDISGADVYITKDFDNIEPVLQEVARLAGHEPFNVKFIQEEAQKINQESVFEMVGNILDKQLFQSTILNQIADAGKAIESVRGCVEQLFSILHKVCDWQIGAFFLKGEKRDLAFVENTCAMDGEQFYATCVRDFLETFPGNAGNIEKCLIGSPSGSESTMHSYACFPLPGGSSRAGTLHLGNSKHQYFSAPLGEDLATFCKGAGVVLSNSLMLHHIRVVESSVREAYRELEENQKLLEKRNHFIKKTFGRYLSEEVVEKILEDPEGQHLGGEKRKVTIMMTDLRGFTSLAERLPPEQVVTVINNYLATMTEIILKYNGIIDEFIGDAILAIFIPVGKDDDSARAVACAIEMQLAMAGVNENGRRLNLPELQMGIGLNTGEVVLGNIGSEKRAKYGVIGRNVNLASRIESYTTGGQILISGSTREELLESAMIQEQMQVNPKGVEDPITIYSVVGIGGEYNLYLSGMEKEPRRSLPKEISLVFTILHGKDVGGAVHNGHIVRLSRKECELRADVELEKFTNLKLKLLADRTVEIPGHLYAKVTEVLEKSTFLVHFTSMPPQAEAFLNGLLSCC